MSLRDLLPGGLDREERALLEQHRARSAVRLGELERLYLHRFVIGVRPDLSSTFADPALAVSVLISAVSGGWNWPRYELAQDLIRRRLSFAEADVDLLVALSEMRGDELVVARAALCGVEQLARDAADVTDSVERLLKVVAAKHSGQGAEWTKLGIRLRRLAPSSPGELDLTCLGAADPWSDRVRREIESRFQGAGRVLALLASATQSKPSRRWLAEVEPLLDAEAADLLRLLLESAVEVESRETGRFAYEGREYVTTLWVSDASATVLRGALWAASLLDDAEWVAPVCEQLVARARKQDQVKVGNAVFVCLGERADDDAVALLSRLVATLKDRRFLKPAQAALERAAEKRGMTGSQLREQLVPTFDLDADGRGVREVGPAQVDVELAPGGSVKLRYRLGGAETAGAPQRLKDECGEALGELKTEIAALRKELGIQRLRVEELLAAGRTWTMDDWRRYYLEQPLVQLFARRLIWRFDGRPLLPLDQDVFVDADGKTARPEASEVQVWHPRTASPDEITAWRTLLQEREILQPFKQAYREIYVLAPAERETEVYSNRFAAHIVRYPQVYALAKTRGWGIRALGPYDNGGGEQWRDFPDHDLRAFFWMEMVDADTVSAIADLASTDQVRFTRIGGRNPIPLDEIPPLVFSEAMRDVDLFVGVASIAADPTWADGGVNRFHAYWEEHAFGELSESAKLRHELLTRLIPGLKIADRLELEDRFLRVRGNLNTYRIHLGSAGIIMEPSGSYLCIVPDRRPAKGRLFLPFEDERLSEILSKAVLLAADDKITDRSIAPQLR